MRDKGRSTEIGWLPLQDSYEEAVLSWYEQIENSFRRREQQPRRFGGPEPASPAKAESDQTRRAFD